VAHAGGDDLDLHLPRAGIADLESVDDLEGVVTGISHQRTTHGRSPGVSGSGGHCRIGRRS
jgi:hypothetical protein